MAQSENGNSSFLKDLIKQFIQNGEKQSEKIDKQCEQIQELGKEIQEICSAVQTIPCFKDSAERAISSLVDNYKKQQLDCQNCSATKLERQLDRKDKMINFMIYVLALLATATAVAAGWVVLPK